MKSKKAQLQISFGWLFAIIVGAVILFLAIYASTKLINVSQTEQDAKTGREIEVLLNPLETSFETGKTTSFTLPVETRIYNDCDNAGSFGTQKIKISQKSFGEWTDTNVDISFYNKYIFSKNPSESEKFYVFSKPFELPFKVADLIYLTSAEDTYCFTEAPEDIVDELSFLAQANIKSGDCTDKDIKVCFESASCDINVNYAGGYVKKDNDNFYFDDDALMYAGIFSDKKTYECQVKRLMQRTENLAIIYNDKSNFISPKGCDSNIDLLALGNLADNLESSNELKVVKKTADEISGLNNNLGGCRLW